MATYLNTRCCLLGVEPEPARPARPLILESYPNPFHAGVTIRFTLPGPSRIDADVLDVSGRRVRSLARGTEFSGGEHTIAWDHRDRDGVSLPSGLYFLRVRAGRESIVARIALME